MVKISVKSAQSPAAVACPRPEIGSPWVPSQVAAARCASRWASGWSRRSVCSRRSRSNGWYRNHTRSAPRAVTNSLRPSRVSRTAWALWPGAMASARSAEIRPVTLVRTRKSRFAGVLCSRTSASRYSATERSVPVNAPIPPLLPVRDRYRVARRTPAGQPWVRSSTAVVSCAVRSTPSARATSATSTASNARSADVSSRRSPVRRSRCRGSSGCTLVSSITDSRGWREMTWER